MKERPIARVLANLEGGATTLTREQLLALHLYEDALHERVRAAEERLKALNSAWLDYRAGPGERGHHLSHLLKLKDDVQRILEAREAGATTGGASQ